MQIGKYLIKLEVELEGSSETSSSSSITDLSATLKSTPSDNNSFVAMQPRDETKCKCNLQTSVEMPTRVEQKCCKTHLLGITMQRCAY